MKNARFFLGGAAIVLIGGTTVAANAHHRTTKNVGYCPNGICGFANYNTLGIGPVTTVNPHNYVVNPNIGAECMQPSDCGTLLTSPTVYASL